MTYETQRVDAHREIMPDLARVLALFGIALVNVGLFSYPMMYGYLDGGLQTGLDKAAFFGVNSLFLLKSYTLFSFMFGVGFAYQIASAQRRGEAFGGQYTRRIIGLLVLGILHVALAFQGDILIIYALLGSVLFLFRNAKVKTLMIWAFVFLSLQILVVALSVSLISMGASYAPQEMADAAKEMDVAAGLSREVFGAGTFAQAVSLRLKEYAEVLFLGLPFQGTGALACFLAGLAAVRSGLINNSSHPLWGKFRRYALPVGIVGSATGAYFFGQATSMMDPKMMLGMLFIVTFSPLSTAGYLGWIAKWAASGPSKFKTFMARGGTATLTAYLMQSLILSLIFNNYGLGWFGTLGAAQCTLIAFITALFTAVFSSLWRKRFNRGPMETLLRGWTYLGRRS